jgi:hypothetical protein
VRLDAGQRRDEGVDVGTLCGQPLLTLARGVPFEALFVAHYGEIRRFCREMRSAGVAVIAVHVPSCRLAGRLWLGAQAGRPSAAVIGRHRFAELLLRDDAEMSLRHLAVILHPVRSWGRGDWRLSVLDLRTHRAFEDEAGRRLEGVRCEGPALLSCGEYALFFLQTGDRGDFPPLAADAWAMLPERVYLDERGAEPDRWARRRVRRDARPFAEARGEAHSLVTAIRGPVRADDALLREGEAQVGTLRIATDAGRRRLAVGRAATERGILLGRYARCDSSDLLADIGVSRTHLLVISIEGTLYAIDTASTCGSYVVREGRLHEFRELALTEAEVEMALVDERVRVGWRQGAT